MKEKTNAGEFSVWLNEFIQTMKGEGTGDVPCGECVACCTSSKFIHIRPTDTDALNAIPKEIMFPAPGLPAGHYLLGYDEKGQCPMFQQGGCSIYASRPETCRQYDCRVFAATGISVEEESPDISKQVRAWEFQFSDTNSRQMSAAVELAAKFLVEHRKHFPEGYVPASAPQLAVMAIRVHKEFLGHTVESVTDGLQSLVNAIVSGY